MTAATPSQLSDFADWLSPMIVKELRQGMRSRVFVIAFYLTQALMVLSVVMNLTLSASDDAPADLAGFLNGLFWFLIGVPLLFAMPLRGFGALYGEMKSQSLELIFLTRLSAWKIVSGKWWGLVGQTALLVCAVLPYLMLRYFFGGVDVVSDLRNLLFLFLGSTVLTALTLALSPYESKLLRALFIIGMIMALQSVFGILLGWMMAGSYGLAGAGRVIDWQFFLGLLVFLPPFVWLCLELAASKIAPPAENHAIPKRLLGLYFPVAAAVLGLTKVADPGILALGFAVSTLVLIDAMGEAVPRHLAALRRLMARGSSGRLAAVFFSPGWPSATWYAIAFCLLAAALAGITRVAKDMQDWLVVVSYLGAVVFPAAVNRLVRRDSPFFLAFYFVIQFLTAGITLIIVIASGMAREPLTLWLAPLPTSMFLISLFDGIKEPDVDIALPVTTSILLLCLAALALRSLAAMRDKKIAPRDNPR